MYYTNGSCDNCGALFTDTNPAVQAGVYHFCNTCTDLLIKEHCKLILRRLKDVWRFEFFPKVTAYFENGYFKISENGICSFIAANNEELLHKFAAYCKKVYLDFVLWRFEDAPGAVN